MKNRIALPLLALSLSLSLAAGCGGGSPSAPAAPGLPVSLACTTTGGLPDAPRESWRVEVSLPGPDGHRAMLFTKSDTFPHQGVAPTTPVSFTARGAGRFDVIAVQLAFDGGSLQLGGFEGAEGSMWSGTADIEADKGVPMSCWVPSWKPVFRYDAATGGCLDANGTTGVNFLVPGMARETKDAECVALSGSLNEGDFSQGQLVGWNLAGADLSQASLEFADLRDADLRGASLAGFEYNYATVSATIDAHTTGIPSSGCATTGGTQLSCQD